MKKFLPSVHMDHLAQCLCLGEFLVNISSFFMYVPRIELISSNRRIPVSNQYPANCHHFCAIISHFLHSWLLSLTLLYPETNLQLHSCSHIWKCKKHKSIWCNVEDFCFGNRSPKFPSLISSHEKYVTLDLPFLI